MRAINHKIRLGTASLLAMVLGSYLYSASADAAEFRNISKVNGGIRVAANEQVGDVSSVNGGIRLAHGASAYEIDTVNGSIELADDVAIEQAESVNGGIRIGENVTDGDFRPRHAWIAPQAGLGLGAVDAGKGQTNAKQI